MAKPQYTSSVVGRLSLVFSVLVLGSVVALVFGGWLHHQFHKPGDHIGPVEFTVARGANLGSTGMELERHGVITNPDAFVWGARLFRRSPTIQAGDYLIPARASMADIIDLFISGKALKVIVTIPEGWSSLQIVKQLNKTEYLTGKINTLPPEGSLLPETYHFPRGTRRVQVLDHLTKAARSLQNKIWRERDRGLPFKSIAEFVTLASIVEKETGVALERSKVASVFVNRLRKGMRLQTDPTILYGLYKGEAWLRPRTIRISEMKAPNRYNTYQIDGLPPGPIANPGRAALEATAHPASTDYLYFVADGTGGHAFAKTLQAHNKNVAKWRKIQKAGAKP